MKPADYFREYRLLRKAPPQGARLLRLGVLSTFTAEVMEPYLVVEAARRGIDLRPWFAPFGQLETVVLEPGSGLYAADPDVILLLIRLEDVGRESTATLDLAAVERRLRGLTDEVRKRSRAAILIANFEPTPPDLGVLGHREPAEIRMNEGIARIAAAVPDAYVFDVHRIAQAVGLARWRDDAALALGRVPFGADAQVAISKDLARYLRALRTPSRKCLVVDLDEVLWGGILGEEGPRGVSLGDDFPGVTYRRFQRALIELRARGILLAIASKNNEQDVREVFATNPEMLLRLDDFAAVRIDWGDKVESLQAIARELNIAVDALVFFDDSPVERERVRRALPQVLVIDVPRSSARYAAALETSEAFDTLVVSAEDRARAESLRRAAEAHQAEQQAESVEDFLRSLRLVVRVGAVTPATLPRVAQLIAKTNQFNLTTRRHSAAEVSGLVQDGAIALWASVSDRFVDHGLTAVAIARPLAEAEWLIDTFLMSCRVLGRTVEDALLAEFLRAIRDRGGARAIGEFNPTAKNEQVADFYPKRGFGPLSGEGQRWVMDLSGPGSTVPAPDYIRVEPDPSLLP